MGSVSDEILPLYRWQMKKNSGSSYDVFSDIFFCRDKARQLLQKDGEEYLARALALISGHTKAIARRSVMSAAKGYITVYVRGKDQIRSLTYVWNIIRNYLFDNPDDKVRSFGCRDPR